ncbi:transposase [Luteimonas sp. TWI1416]|uniref:transposase n=1 Tax=unclassified Luteimonas TaxID=2629088 RepID=UPI003209F79E
MPRRPRIDLPDVAQHIVQRGNDRQSCFFDDTDRLGYLQDLRETARQHGCAIHAHVLMSNHVHLLATPAAAGQIARMMQSLGRRYVRWINARHGRTGTLWEGRYKACPVIGEAYLLRCLRYIERNPLRARMVDEAAEYPCSSHRGNIGAVDDPLSPHPAWQGLASSPALRHQAWRALVAEAVDANETEAIAAHLQRQHLYGSEHAWQALEARLGRPAGPVRRGRPPCGRAGRAAENAR